MPDRPTKAARSRTHHHDVFISSTSKDLPDHRKAAIDAVWRRTMYPLAMEAGTAWDGDAVAYSLSMADEAEVYVGIFAYRYGYVPDGSDISITEMEYRRAVERDIPCLIFIMGDDHPGPAKAKDHDDFYESDAASKKKLESLKAELMDKHVVGFFNSAQELGNQVFQALSTPKLTERLKANLPEDAEPISRVHRLRTIPDPPEPYIAHPYILTRQFFGRRDELAKLDAWARGSDTTLIVEAIGGVGKSALTWHWLEEEHPQTTIPDLAGVIWWSFYESDSDMRAFIREALQYVSGMDDDAIKNLSGKERLNALLTELRQRPYLLVLDGIERIMVAYHRMDAPHLRDEDVETATSAADKERHLRSCTDPRHGEILRQLTTCAPTRVLISTRLCPHDLEDRNTGDRIPGVTHLHLNGLAPDDALALLRHHGVKGNARKLKDFMAQFGYHSLLLGVLAGRIKNYRPAPGDFARWYTREGRTLKLSSIEITQRRTHILQYALDGLHADALKLLCQVAAFRYPVEYDALAALNPYLPPKPEKQHNPERLATLSELSER
jgi:hypothetical protein